MSDKSQPLEPYPTQDDGSLGYQVARATVDAAASAIPGAGYVAGAFIDRFIGEPLAKRRDVWFERLGEGLKTLEDRLTDFDPENLDKNEDFVSAVFEATQAAMKTVKEEKLEALRNGVLNIAAGFDLNDVLRGSLFGLVERYSPAHTHVLRLLADPSKSPEMVQAARGLSMGSQGHVLRAAVPPTVSDAALERVFADLSSDGLANTGSMKGMGTSAVFLVKRTTEIGDTFLAFISDPF